MNVNAVWMKVCKQLNSISVCRNSEKTKGCMKVIRICVPVWSVLIQGFNGCVASTGLEKCHTISGSYSGNTSSTNNTCVAAALTPWTCRENLPSSVDPPFINSVRASNFWSAAQTAQHDSHHLSLLLPWCTCSLQQSLNSKASFRYILLSC